MVPLDGSSTAEIALPMAMYLAQAFEADITLFHAIEKNPPGQIHGERHLEHAEEARRYLEEIVRRFQGKYAFKGRILSHIHLEESADVATSIADHMTELGPDLVVMCSHGRSNFTQVLIGSLATRVIGLGSAPVLLLKSDAAERSATKGGATESGAPGIAHVVVALDNASIHDKAIDYGKEISEAVHARLVLLSVVPTFSSLKGKDGGWGLMSPATSSAILDIEEQKLREHLSAHQKSLAEAGIACSISVLRGDPAHEITGVAKKLDQPLIVLGTHGRSGMKAFWKGSVAAKIVSLSSAPILLVPLHE
jgi:nucleotide-binding universal stress UspA family protein